MSNQEQKPKLIYTFGDSLTEGNARKGKIGTDGESFFPNLVQTWIMNKLKEENINAIVINEGIGGQIFEEIWDRIEEATEKEEFDANGALTVMAGTNNVWRYSDMDEDIKEDLWEMMEEEFKKMLPILAEKFKGMPIIICSIPPFGKTSSLPKNGIPTIHFLNNQIKIFIDNNKEKYSVYFCDVHAAMQIDDGSMNPDFAIADGVHFTPEGNKACGQAIGNCLIKIFKN